MFECVLRPLLGPCWALLRSVGGASWGLLGRHFPAVWVVLVRSGALWGAPGRLGDVTRRVNGESRRQTHTRTNSHMTTHTRTHAHATIHNHTQPHAHTRTHTAALTHIHTHIQNRTAGNRSKRMESVQAVFLQRRFPEQDKRKHAHTKKRAAGKGSKTQKQKKLTNNHRGVKRMCQLPRSPAL